MRYKNLYIATDIEGVAGGGECRVAVRGGARGRLAPGRQIPVVGLDEAPVHKGAEVNGTLQLGHDGIRHGREA